MHAASSRDFWVNSYAAVEVIFEAELHMMWKLESRCLREQK